MMATATRPTGAGFLLGDAAFAVQRTPEDLTEDQRMLRRTVHKFAETEVVPRLEELEQLKPELLKELVAKAGELGLYMIDVPEEYGGLGLDYISSIQPPEILHCTGGFAACFAAQSVLGTLPILYFGTEEQKRQYLPPIASGQAVSAYALTEPGSGSDALAAKTTAMPSEDGAHWILNGSKQFITNGGMASIFIVFAQAGGRDFSAFIVERETPGFSVGREEHKMGIRSSSTTPLTFENCKIPKENLLGEVGWGGRIALNVLNVGRLKLGVGGVGGGKEALEIAARYANERRQFGKAIGEFGIIREKIAEMAARIYAAESTAYRTAGNIDDTIRALKAESSHPGPQAMMDALHEFNVECAIEKVHGSEVEGFCADEAVQIHGGYGFIEEYKAARLYRDARIARLYEGTNEINRMQIAGDVLKRVSAGEVKLNVEGPEPAAHDFGKLDDVMERLRRTKVALGRLIALVNEGFGGKLDKYGENQELFLRLADIIIAIYGIESAAGRAAKAHEAGSPHADAFEAMTRIYETQANAVALHRTREALAHLAAGGAPSEQVHAIEELARHRMINAIPLRRYAAREMLERNGEWFEAS